MAPGDAPELCDVCGSSALIEIKCKMICRNCGTIVRSCADLSEPLGWRAMTLLAVTCAVSVSCASRHPAQTNRTATKSTSQIGLWDAHTHLSWYGEAALDSLTAYGVVGVRDCGGDAIQLRTWRDEIARGTRRGPRIYFSGPVIDGGDKTASAFRVLVSTPEQATRVVDSLAALGVDFIKTHNGIPHDAFFAVIRAARAHGLKVAAHLPKGVPAWVAADSGVAGIEHAAESMLASPIYAGYATDITGAIAWWRSAAGDSALAKLARQGVTVTPTLVTYKSFVNLPADEESRRGRAAVLVFLEELTGRMHRAGITLLAGSDFARPSSGIVPGRATREEVELLIASGLTRAEATDAASGAIQRWVQKRRRP